MIDKRALVQIEQRLSLRRPQGESLSLLADVIDLIDPSKETDVGLALAAIQRLHPLVEDFERAFPSLCFAIATGVGKTRLMGAFISYLFMTGKSRNFFVLAPNLTIYEKLLADFQPQSPKYVFRGVEAFAHQPPLIVNADNYEEGRGVRGADLLGQEAAIINVFNISKINSEARGGNAPRIKRLQECIGESYFAYLSGLPDLVLLMDEAHRYRASAGAKAIEELKPILGLEVTATPKSTGARPVDFKNVIYRYDLSQAMADGFVKEPAVATRANFDPKTVSNQGASDKLSPLEEIKLTDGIHYHEHVKVQLQTYALQNSQPLVVPFMLVVAQDVAHAKLIRSFIESDRFFDGRYAGKVAEVHSKQSGEESDENAEKLLNVERDGKTEIVVHVNKLKEGWDVTNLYTIVPLRASASEILTEQTLGRGLRLPYGKRTGVEAVDTLTVIAHDSFQQVIDAAKDSGLIHKKLTIGEGGDVTTQKPTMVQAPSVIQAMLQKASRSAAPAPTPAEAGGEAQPGVRAGDTTTFEYDADTDGPAFTFNRPEEVKLAESILANVLPGLGRKVNRLADLNSAKIVQQVANEAVAALQATEDLFKTEIAPERAAQVAEEVLKVFTERTIAIPQIVISPQDQVSFWFQRFDLNGLEAISLQPDSPELIVQGIRTGKRTVISREQQGVREARLENYIVRELILRDEVDYGSHAELLYDLAGQVVARLKSYLPSEDAVVSVLERFGHGLADFIFRQMKEPKNMGRTQTTYRVTLDSAFSTLRPQHFDAAGKDLLRDFRQPPERASEIKRLVFHGFKRACYPLAKFDSDQGERTMAVLLEDDASVEKWMRPGPGQFRIEDADGNPYHPDFVVETATEKLIVEPKQRSALNDADVLRKADAAVLWCHIANQALPAGEKPWRYLLVPHDAISARATLSGLIAQFSRSPSLELMSRYRLVGSSD